MKQDEFGLPEAAPVQPSSFSLPPSAKWPKTLAEQAQAVRAALTAHGIPADAVTLAKTFKSARTDRVAEILETLASLGQARVLDGGKFISA